MSLIVYSNQYYGTSQQQALYRVASKNQLYPLFWQETPIRPDSALSDDNKREISDIKLIIEKLNELNEANGMEQIVIGFSGHTHDRNTYYRTILFDASGSTLKERGDAFISQLNEEYTSTPLQSWDEMGNPGYNRFFFQCNGDGTWTTYKTEMTEPLLHGREMNWFEKEYKNVNGVDPSFINTDYNKMFTAPQFRYGYETQDGEKFDLNAQWKAERLASKLAVGVSAKYSAGNNKDNIHYAVYVPVTVMDTGKVYVSNIDGGATNTTMNANYDQVQNFKYNSIGQADCQGEWGSCIDGSQTYTITQPAFFGNECPHEDGAISGECIHCSGTWSDCDASCLRAWNEVVAQGADGDGCPSMPACNAGDGQCSAPASNDSATDNGASNVDCSGHWSDCSNGERKYIITVEKQGDGKACEHENGKKKNVFINCWWDNLEIWKQALIVFIIIIVCMGIFYGIYKMMNKRQS